MQARIKQSSRYGTAQLFSGLEFVKHEWRQVPAQFEEQARKHELLEVREGKAEKEVIEKQVQDTAVKTMKARLVSSYDGESLRTLGGIEFVKDQWLDVPEGSEDSARRHELLQVWEIDEPEPKKTKSSGRSFGSNTKAKDKEEKKSTSSRSKAGKDSDSVSNVVDDEDDETEE